MEKDNDIKFDLAGYPYNGKYPPNCPGSQYNGYKTPAEECLFYDFAVLGYDLMIKYQGLSYYFMVDEDCVWLSDEKFTAKKQKFSNANEALETFMIGNQPIVLLIEQLDEFEIY